MRTHERPTGCQCTRVDPVLTEAGRCVDCERVDRWLAERPREPWSRYLAPRQLAKLMGRAITEGWDVPPDEAAKLVSKLIDTFHSTSFNQDRVAIAGHLLKIPALKLKEAELELRKKGDTGDRPRVIVVREIDGGLAETPSESDEGAVGGEPV